MANFGFATLGPTADGPGAFPALRGNGLDAYATNAERQCGRAVPRDIKAVENELRPVARTADRNGADDDSGARAIIDQRRCPKRQRDGPMILAFGHTAQLVAMCAQPRRCDIASVAIAKQPLRGGVIVRLFAEDHKRTLRGTDGGG